MVTLVGGSDSTDGAVSLREIDTACTTPGHTAADRVDLYWSGVRSAGTGQVAMSWTSRTSLARYRSSGILHARSLRLGDQAEALDKVLARPTRLAALGAIHLWRTVTAEQVAAIVGEALLASTRSVDLRLLLAAGLAQRGVVFAGDRRAAVRPLWRPDLSARELRFEDRLSYAEWLGVYAGQEWSFGPQAGWHNLLATELSLRVAELTPIGTVFGELLAAERLLFPGRPESERSRRSADAVWVRDDGLRILVEVTANANAAVRTRIDHWIRALLTDTEASSIVVFVDVSDPDGKSRPDHLLRRALADAVTSTPERMDARIAERICFARYRDWFPDRGLVHPSFLGLRVERPTGRPGARWETVDLLDPYAVPFSPADQEAARAPIVHAGDLFGVPHWLRGSGVDLDAVVRRLAGFPPPAPMSPERRAELARRFAGRAFADDERADSQPVAQDGHGDHEAPDPAEHLPAGPRRPRPLPLASRDLGNERGGA